MGVLVLVLVLVFVGVCVGETDLVGVCVRVWVDVWLLFGFV